MRLLLLKLVLGFLHHCRNSQGGNEVNGVLVLWLDRHDKYFIYMIKVLVKKIFAFRLSHAEFISVSYNIGFAFNLRILNGKIFELSKNLIYDTKSLKA